MIVLDLSILNQKGTPMFNSDTFANRPNFGIVGRIFISTDSPFGLFRDTGSAWDQISSAGGADTNIYNTSGTLTSNRVVSSGGFNLTINASTTFATTLTAAIGTGSVSAFGVNTLSYAAAFSSSNLGSVYGAIGGFNLQTFAGSATFANANIAAANTSINSVDFSTGGSTITMTQATGLRVMAGHINMFQYQGTNSATITHAAVSQNLGFYRPPSATGILTITNAYGFLINNLNDYGAGFTFTNRFGIYQAGASDVNYFAANTLIGGTTDLGHKLMVYGRIGFNTSGQTNTITNFKGANSSGFNIFIGGGGEFSVGTVVNTFLGSRNVSLGETAFFLNTEGYANTAIGRDSLYNNTTGSLNVALGYASFLGNTTGDNNTAVGVSSGRFTNSGGSNQTSIQGTFIGSDSRGENGINEITIGYQAQSAGSNSATLGNINILKTILNGNILIGSLINPGQKLYLNGSLRIDGQTSGTSGGNSGQHLIINLDGTSYKIALLNP